MTDNYEHVAETLLVDSAPTFVSLLTAFRGGGIPVYDPEVLSMVTKAQSRLQRVADFGHIDFPVLQSVPDPEAITKVVEENAGAVMVCYGWGDGHLEGRVAVLLAKDDDGRLLAHVFTAASNESWQGYPIVLCENFSDNGSREMSGMLVGEEWGNRNSREKWNEVAQSLASMVGVVKSLLSGVAYVTARGLVEIGLDPAQEIEVEAYRLPRHASDIESLRDGQHRAINLQRYKSWLH